MQGTLKLKGVSASYGKRLVLHDVALEIGEKENVGLIGPNGSGKSTLLRVIAGVLGAKTGIITFGGDTITSWSVARRVRSGIVYLLQDRSIFPSLGVRENLQIAGLLLPAAERAAREEMVLDLFPVLRERLASRAGLLSGGQRQALALALVFLQKPRLLLLDEPTAGLSPAMAESLFRAIEKSQEALGYSAVLVEHRLTRVKEFSDRIVVLVQGGVKEVVTDPDRLLEDREELDKLLFR